MMHFPEAFWAASSAWAAWTIGAIGLLLNAAGIYLLIAQLRANQTALKAAAESADAATEAAKLARLDTRPWLKPNLPKYLSGGLIEGDGYFNFRFSFPLSVENVGRTPALMVSASVEMIRAPSITDVDAAVARMSTGALRSNQTIFPGEDVAMPMKLTAMMERGDFQSGVKVVCVLVITYQAHIGGEVLATPVVLALSNTDATDPPVFRTLQLERGLSQVEAVPFVLHSRSPS